MNKGLSRFITAAICLGFIVTSGFAQNLSQLQLYSQLPPEQKEALARQLNGEPTGPQEVGAIEEAPPAVIREGDGRLVFIPDEVKYTNEPLRPFGYDLFRAQPTTFAPVADAPVPPEYAVGPGDNLLLRLFGKESAEYNLVVDRVGQVFLPEIGPLVIAGKRFDQASEAIIEWVEKAKIGVTATVAMGELRSIRIFVAGEARNPGSYTVSSLATITQALYVSGGIKEIGSLRKIELRRGGERITTLDLYDLLMRGDARNDYPLQSGDVVFVPPVGKTVALTGAVRRPAIYELREERALHQAITLAGGVVPGAVIDRVLVERVENGRRSFISAGAVGVDADLLLQSGDTIKIAELLQDTDNGIEVFGNARWPGIYSAGVATRFTDIVRSTDDLKPLSDIDFALIMRRVDGGSQLRPIYVNPRRAFAGDDAANIQLRSGDQLYLFSALAAIDEHEAPFDEDKESTGDQRTLSTLQSKGSTNLSSPEMTPEANGLNGIESLSKNELLGVEGDVNSAETTDAAELGNRISRMGELAGQLQALARFGEPASVVEVVGAIRFPGRVPLDRARNSIRDVLRAVGGMPSEAEAGFFEVTRAPKRIVKAREASREIVRVDSPEVDEVRIYPGDTLAVRTVPGFDEKRSVTLLGEVLYPGSYTVTVGTTLAELVERAGGLTKVAFPRGAVFTREALRHKEMGQVYKLRSRLRANMAAASLMDSASKGRGLTDVLTLSALFDELDGYQPIGRLVIDLNEQIAGRAKPVVLDDGDRLVIPSVPEEVTVIGEVQFPTSHRWERGGRRREYLDRSGGFTKMADERRVFIVRADGSVDARGYGWFAGGPQLQPGDTIVVPMDVTPIRPLTLFSSVTQVLYQLAVTAAAFNSVGVF